MRCHWKILCRDVASSPLTSAAAATSSSSLILNKCLLYARCCSKHCPYINSLKPFKARTRYYWYQLDFTNNITSTKRLDELLKLTKWVGGRTKIQTQVVRLQILELCDLCFKMIPLVRRIAYRRTSIEGHFRSYYRILEGRVVGLGSCQSDEKWHIDGFAGRFLTIL